jgi:hypothetical protein
MGKYLAETGFFQLIIEKMLGMTHPVHHFNKLSALALEA